MGRDRKREEAINRGKLALALLKERYVYREFFKEKSRALTVALKRYRKWYEQERRVSTEYMLEAMSVDSRVFNDFRRECENRFGIANPPLMANISVDEVLLFLDPERNIEDIPKGIESVLIDMFSPERITQVANDGIPLGALLYEWARVSLLLPEKIEPYQRLLLVDMRGSSATLKKRFAAYLDSVKRTRKLPCPQDNFREDWHTYDNWRPDNSRQRKESWECLEVWHMVANRGMKPKAIADELRHRFPKITLDDIKYRFKRGHQLTQGFDCPPWGIKDIRTVKLAALMQTCRTCDKRESCESPCAEIDRAADQGKKAQRERMSGKEPGFRSDDPRVRTTNLANDPAEDSDDNPKGPITVILPSDLDTGAKLDPCGNPIKRKEAPLPLTPEQIKKRKERAKGMSRTDS